MVALAIVGGVGAGALQAGEPINLFTPLDGATPLKRFDLEVKGQELDPQQFLKFDFEETHDGIPSIKLSSEAGERVMLKGAAPITLEPGRRYVLRVLVKFSELTPVNDGRSTGGQLFVIYVRSAGKSYRVLRIGPSAESNGWVKAFLPFDSGEADYDKVRVQFRLHNLRGSVWICDPRIVEVPENFPKERFFELPSGERVSPLVLFYNEQFTKGADQAPQRQVDPD